MDAQRDGRPPRRLGNAQVRRVVGGGQHEEVGHPQGPRDVDKVLQHVALGLLDQGGRAAATPVMSSEQWWLCHNLVRPGGGFLGVSSTSQQGRDSAI